MGLFNKIVGWFFGIFLMLMLIIHFQSGNYSIFAISMLFIGIYFFRKRSIGFAVVAGLFITFSMGFFATIEKNYTSSNQGLSIESAPGTSIPTQDMLNVSLFSYSVMKDWDHFIARDSKEKLLPLEYVISDAEGNDKFFQKSFLYKMKKLETNADDYPNNNTYKMNLELYKQQAKEGNWQLLHSWGNDKGSWISNDGFRGIALYRDKNEQGVKDNTIIISFRGTDDVSDFSYDLASVILQTDPSTQLNSAYDFLEQVSEEIKRLEIPQPVNVIITGHSLGGFLAQKISAEIIENKNSVNAAISTSTNTPMKWVSTVTFNAPGFKDINAAQFQSLVDPYFFNQQYGYEKFPILNYVIEKDMVGNFGSHLGRTTFLEHAEGSNKHELLSFYGLLEDDSVIKGEVHKPFLVSTFDGTLIETKNGLWGIFVNGWSSLGLYILLIFILVTGIKSILSQREKGFFNGAWLWKVVLSTLTFYLLIKVFVP